MNAIAAAAWRVRQHELARGDAAREDGSYDGSMCLICIDLDRSVMTTREARRALGEMRVKLDPAHIAEVEKKLDEAERDDDPPPTTP